MLCLYEDEVREMCLEIASMVRLEHRDDIDVSDKRFADVIQRIIEVWQA